MNKEQIAFCVVLALLGLMYVGCGDDSKRRSLRRGVRPPEIAPQAAVVPDGRFFEESDRAWLSDGNNFFRAPRETEDMKPLRLLPPPFPRLVHPGLPLVPPVGGAAARGLRHELVPDGSIELAPVGENRVFEAEEPAGTDPSANEAANGEANLDELDKVDTSNVGLTLAEQLRMRTEERLARDKEEELKKQQEIERRRGLDTITWATGDVSYGEVETLESKDDRYRIKLRIDAIRADPSLSDDQRKKILEEIKIVFREDRGREKKRGRMVLNGAAIQRVEFAPNLPLNRFWLAKLQSKEGDFTSQWHLSDIAFDAGELDVCAEHLEEMHRLGLESEASYARLSDCYRRLFRYDQEMDALQKGLARFEGSVPLLARRGQVLLRLQLRSKAEDSFRKALEKEPSNALAQMGMGQALLEQDDVKAATVHLRQAQTGVGLDDDQKIQALVLLAQAYLRLGNVASAELTFNDAVLNRRPTDRDGLLGSAVVAFCQGGAQAAKAVVDRGREAHPLDGRLAYLDGVALLRLGDYAKAQDALHLCMELDPLLTAHARTALSYLQEKVGQDEAALGEADQALVGDPLSLPARLQRARCLLNVGDLAGATSEYLRVLSGDPTRTDVLVALGDAAFRLDDTQSAARFYERAAELEPDFPDLLGRRLICEVRRGDRAGTEARLKAVTAQLTRDPFIQVAQAYYHYEQRQQPQEALQRLRPIVEKKTAWPRLISYADTVIEAVSDNLNKEEWRDDFKRSGSRILKGWNRQIGTGINVALQDQRIAFKGTQKKLSDEPTVLYQERPGRQFHSFSVDLDMKPEIGVYKGIGLIAFQRAPQGVEPYAGLQKREGGQVAYYGAQVALSPDGKLQFRYLNKGKMSEWEDLPTLDYSGGPISLGLEVVDRKKSMFRLIVDGKPIAAKVQIPELARRARTIEIQIFCQASIDAGTEFWADNVSIVTLKK